MSLFVSLPQEAKEEGGLLSAPPPDQDLVLQAAAGRGQLGLDLPVDPDRLHRGVHGGQGGHGETGSQTRLRQDVEL